MSRATEAGPAPSRGVAPATAVRGTLWCRGSSTCEVSPNLTEAPPRGAGRRWPGAFGLIPGQATNSTVPTGAPA